MTYDAYGSIEVFLNEHELPDGSISLTYPIIGTVYYETLEDTTFFYPCYKDNLHIGKFTCLKEAKKQVRIAHLNKILI